MSEALEVYRRASNRGIWLDIANSQMTNKERAIAISWRYQALALSVAKGGDHEQAISFAGFIANDQIRESAMAQVYQIKRGSAKKSKPAIDGDPKPNHKAAARQGLRQRSNSQPTQTRLLPEANTYYRQSA